VQLLLFCESLSGHCPTRILAQNGHSKNKTNTLNTDKNQIHHRARRRLERPFSIARGATQASRQSFEFEYPYPLSVAMRDKYSRRAAIMAIILFISLRPSVTWGQRPIVVANVGKRASQQQQRGGGGLGGVSAAEVVPPLETTDEYIQGAHRRGARGGRVFSFHVVTPFLMSLCFAIGRGTDRCRRPHSAGPRTGTGRLGVRWDRNDARREEGTKKEAFGWKHPGKGKAGSDAGHHGTVRYVANACCMCSDSAYILRSHFPNLPLPTKVLESRPSFTHWPVGSRTTES
jgi:hypothetical protein